MNKKKFEKMSHAYPISDPNQTQKTTTVDRNKEEKLKERHTNTREPEMKHISTMTEYRDIMSRQEPKMIFKFSAKWCGPCRTIQPFYEKLAKETPNMQFYHVDVDALGDVAAVHNVQSLPTFIYFENAKAKSQIIGPSQRKLEDFVTKAVKSVGSAGSIKQENK
jgi:thioredoxin 1